MLRDLLNKPRPKATPRPLPTGPKPVLEMRQVPVYVVHYQALEKYIDKVYGIREFDFYIATGAQEGISVEYQVDGEIPETDGWLRQVGDVRLGRRTKNVLLLLKLMVHDKFIPAGKYIIDTRKPVDPIVYYGELLKKTRSPIHPDCLALKERIKDRPAVLEKLAQMDKTLIASQQA